MTGARRLSQMASVERYRTKNKESLNIKRKINYYKQKIKMLQKELKEAKK